MTKQEIKNSLKQQCGSNSRFYRHCYKAFKKGLKKADYKYWMVSDIYINKDVISVIILFRIMTFIYINDYRR